MKNGSIQSNLCFECGLQAEYEHHVVPFSKGGTKTVYLCGRCHGKAHHREHNMTSAMLTKFSLAEKRLRGEKLGGTVPYGHRLLPDGMLVLFPEEQRVVKLMCKMRADGSSYGAIARHLNSAMIASKTGTKWSSKVVRDVIARNIDEGV